MADNSLKNLLGKDLAGYQIIAMVEVFKIGDDGKKSKSLGFFRDPTIAKAFAGNQTDSNYYMTAPALVLTNEVEGFSIKGESVRIFNDKEVANTIRKQAIAKLSPAERQILGV